MQVVTEKKKAIGLTAVLAAVKKLSVEEKQLLKLKLYGADAIKELKAFEALRKKQYPATKKSDAELVAAVKKIRLRNAL